MEGRATPSASPKKARAINKANVEWLAAQGVIRVAKDHKATPQPITFFPPCLSTNAPPITDENMYPHRNDDWYIRLFCVFMLATNKAQHCIAQTMQR